MSLTLITGTSPAQVKNYDSKGSVKIISAKTYLKITPKPQDISENEQAASTVFGAILPPLIDIANSTVKTVAKQNALKYQGQYKAFNSQSGFYQNKDFVNLPALELKRQILKKGDHTVADAVIITLIPELSSDKKAFRYKVDGVDYRYSIAKTKRDWDFIDLTLELKFTSLGINKEKYEVKDLRGTNIFIPMVKVGGGYAVDANAPVYSGWIPFPPVTIQENEVQKREKESKEVVSDKTKEGKPLPTERTKEITTTDKKTKEAIHTYENAGMYEIEITVMETNPYRIKAENKQQFIENSGDEVSDLLKAVTGLGKDEKDEKEK